jgi:hypothetical protein
MWRVPACLVVVFLVSGPDDGLARRVHLSEEQHFQLVRIHTVLVKAVMLTDKGRVESEAFRTLVAKRFEAFGFETVTDPALPHDVVVHMVCEERKRTVGTTRAGSDAELDRVPDRLWQGPACRLRYHLNGEDLGWKTEVHPSPDELDASPSEPGVPFERSSRFTCLFQAVERSEFPILAMADWGQTDRLTDLLLKPETGPGRARLILNQLANFSDLHILPVLLTIIQRRPVPLEAVEALGASGDEAVPHLAMLFEDRRHDPMIRAAAAKGLGRLGGSTGNPSAMNPLADYLAEAVATIQVPDDIDFPVLTAVVWALGQGHSDRVLQLLGRLQETIWMYHETSPGMEALREAAAVVSRYLEHVQL